MDKLFLQLKVKLSQTVFMRAYRNKLSLRAYKKIINCFDEVSQTIFISYSGELIETSYLGELSKSIIKYGMLVFFSFTGS
jgi:hypothetical protein